MKTANNLSGILKSDEIKRIPAETVAKIDKYFEELEGIRSKRHTEYLKFHDKLTELTKNDADKSMELERMRIENAELRKQLEKVQTEVSVLKHSGFTFDEIDEIVESRAQLTVIQSDLKYNFKDFETKTMNIKSRLAKLCERFMVKFVNDDFCDSGRGKTLADIHDALHRISFRYNEWHNSSLIEIRRQCHETETQMTGAIYLIYEKLKAIEQDSAGKFDDGFGTNDVMSYTSMQQPSNNNNQFGQVWPMCNTIQPSQMMMPSQGVSFVNGFNHLQPNFNETKPNKNDNHQSFADFLNKIMADKPVYECPSSIYRGSVPVNAATFGNSNSSTSKSPGVIKRPVSKNGQYGSNTNSASTSNSTASTSSAFCSNDSDSPNRQQFEHCPNSSFRLFY